jgi:hypothetical protein
MKFQSFLKSASIGAGVVIFVAGIALAQTTPAPAPAPQAAPQTAPKDAAPTPGQGRPDWRAMRRECQDKIGSDVPRRERREKMRECMNGAGGPGAGMGRGNGMGPGGMGPGGTGSGDMGDGRQGRGAQRMQSQKVREARKACFDQLKDQRLTVDERRGEMQKCVLEKVPEHAKQMTCRQEAENKKLERRTREFRTFMRQCITAP